MQNGFVSDVRHATRALLRARGFTTVAVGTLAVSLALCVSVATVVNAYLLRGLPYPESDRLFSTRYAAPGTPGPTNMEALDWASLNDIIEHPISWDLDNFSLRGAPHPELATGTWVTPGYMEGFGIRPAMGRVFEPADFQEGRPSVALISHRIWQTRFGGDPLVLGKQFQAHVNDRPGELENFTVVGVLPDAPDVEAHVHIENAETALYHQAGADEHPGRTDQSAPADVHGSPEPECVLRAALRTATS